ARAKASGQNSLFGGDEGASPVLRDVFPAEVEEWPERDRLSREREALGFYLTGHPLTRHLEDLQGVTTHTTGSLHAAPAGAAVTLGGMVSGLSRKKTRKGDTMAIFSLEDIEGSVEVIVFPDLFGRVQSIFTEEIPILVSGKAESDETRVRVIAEELIPLSNARASRTGSVHLRVPVGGVTEETIARLKGLLEGNRGECPVFLELTQPGAFALTLKADGAWSTNPSREMVTSVEEILGPGSVRLKARAGRPAGARRS
ncbi:MAG TPA: OB-fold nucleic acid binding domain-containing protein, partial [Verrucomicrobiae bacterium]|nr:OB-fold nucleic acid binding domain-containing protein [Verrucomicrobiae bacterium]